MHNYNSLRTAPEKKERSTERAAQSRSHTLEEFCELSTIRTFQAKIVHQVGEIVWSEIRSIKLYSLWT